MTKDITMRRMVKILCLAGLLVAAMATRSMAVEYDFYSLTGDSQADYLFMDVTDSGNGTASFEFTSSVPDASVVTTIYWDFGDQNGNLTNSTWTSHPNTSFVEGAASANLPGGQAPEVGFYSDYSLEREAKGGVANGLNAGEWLKVVWTLSGIDFDGLLAALNSGEMRIGMHVQSVGDDGEDSFSAVSPTPIPGAAWLLGSGLLGLVGLRRKMKL
ncbi:MAG: hypothetical protein H0S80_12560 [Desulfovibrionaceae bacterium]|nr:hypothetical protein [Desulfovibrionaceae bacterium]